VGGQIGEGDAARGIALAQLSRIQALKPNVCSGALSADFLEMFSNVNPGVDDDVNLLRPQ
jgi:hypothetical protein